MQAHAAAFRAALVAALRAQPTQPCYYPGSRARRAEVVRRYGGGAGDINKGGAGDVKGGAGGAVCTVVCGAARKGNAADDDEVALIELGAAAASSPPADAEQRGFDGFDGDVLRREAFGAVLAVVEVGADDGDGGGGGDGVVAAAAADYLERIAVPFANSEACAGCLSCSVLVPCATATADAGASNPLFAPDSPTPYATHHTLTARANASANASATATARRTTHFLPASPTPHARAVPASPSPHAPRACRPHVIRRRGRHMYVQAGRAPTPRPSSARWPPSTTAASASTAGRCSGPSPRRKSRPAPPPPPPHGTSPCLRA